MKNIREGIVAAIYLILMTLLYCSFNFENVGILIGGFHILYFYIFGIIIIVFTMCCFLFWPDIGRGILLTKYSIVLSLLYFSSIFFSLIVWIVEMSVVDVIVRGLFVAIYQLIAVLVAASSLYLFGEKGIYMDLAAMTLTYLIAIVQALMLGGGGQFIQEFIRLIVTFSLETGPLMTIMEDVNLQFSLGIHLVFFVVSAKGNPKKDYLAIGLIIFFSIISIKRIVLLSAVMASIVGWIMRCMSKDLAKKLLILCCFLFGIGSYIYVWLIGNGLFNRIEDLGVDTMARVYMYEDFRQFYELNITHIGRGLGFVTKMLEIGNLTNRVGITDIHNDLLRQYIEQGFFGFIIWAFGLFYFRVGYFMKRNIDYGIIVFAIILNSFITYLTDNTYVLFFPNISTALAIMAYQFDTEVKKDQEVRWKK